MVWENDHWTGWASGMGDEQSIMIMLFWTLIIAGMVIFFRRFSGSNKAKFSNRLTTPIEILQSRYARRKWKRYGKHTLPFEPRGDRFNPGRSDGQER